MTAPRPHARVLCDVDGEITLPTPDITVRRCVDDGTVSYRYRCPLCDELYVREARQQDYTALLGFVDEVFTYAFGYEEWKRPKVDTPAGPPLTNVDALMFMVELDSLPTADR